MKASKMLSVLLAVSAAAGLTACGGGAAGDVGGGSSDAGTTLTGGSTESAASQAAKPSGNRVVIKWLTTGDQAAPAIKPGDRIIQAIDDKLGIDLQVEIVPESNVEKVNVAMASGDFPDIVTGAYGTSATQQWIDSSMVIPMNHYMETQPAIMEYMKPYDWTAIDGKYYGLPFITQMNTANTLVIMRQDWLDKLNLKYPVTLDDMKKVLTAFTKEDPDGDGKADTYGYTCPKPGTDGSTPFDWVFFANGLPYADYSLDANDNVIPWFEDASFIPSMKYIKDLWDSGVVDPEFMLNDRPKAEEKFFQGKSGSLLGATYRHIVRYDNSLKQLYPDGSTAYGLSPKGPTGKFGLSRQGKGGMMTCITTACKNPDKAAEFINFMVSKEGNDMLRLGIEGIHYTKDGDKIVFNEDERKKDAFASDGWAHALAWGSFYWPLEANYIPATDPDRARELDTVKVASQCQVKNLIKQKTPAEISDGSAVNDIFIQSFSDMLQGKVSIEDGAASLSKDWRSQGGSDILKEVNAAYKASKGK